MCFGNKLKNARLSKKLSIRKLAELSNVNASYISRLERGIDTRPGIKVILNLCKSLDLPPEKLLTKDELKLIEKATNLGTNLSKSLVEHFEKTFSDKYLKELKYLESDEYIDKNEETIINGYKNDLLYATELFNRHGYKVVLDEFKSVSITSKDGNIFSISDIEFLEWFYQIINRIYDFEKFEINQFLKKDYRI